AASALTTAWSAGPPMSPGVRRPRSAPTSRIAPAVALGLEFGLGSGLADGARADGAALADVAGVEIADGIGELTGPHAATAARTSSAACRIIAAAVSPR